MKQKLILIQFIISLTLFGSGGGVTKKSLEELAKKSTHIFIGKATKLTIKYSINGKETTLINKKEKASVDLNEKNLYVLW